MNTIEIKNRFTGEVLYSGQGESLKAVIEQAAAKNVSLTGAALNAADLSDAKLAGVSLEYADLSGAKLLRANLAGAGMFGAVLTNANLAGANLDGAVLDHSNLDGTNLAKIVADRTNRGTHCVVVVQGLQVGRERVSIVFRAESGEVWLDSVSHNLAEFKELIANPPYPYQSSEAIAERECQKTELAIVYFEGLRRLARCGN